MIFYEPHKRDRKIFPHDPFKALIAPRPIGWVSTMSSEGALNLAPYSYFNAFGSRPPIIGFASEGWKDSCEFAAQTREFVWNLPTFALRDKMNASSASLPRGASEFTHAGLTAAPSRIVKVPRVAETPCALECKLIEIKQLTAADGRKLDSFLVLGEVVGVHIDESVVADGMVDITKLQPIARCGYADYAVVDTVFGLDRPT